jgi:hypothetical protein
MGIYREENVIEKAKVRLDAEIYRRNVFVKCYTLETPFEPRTGKVVYASLFVFHMSSAFQEVQRYMEAGILEMLTKKKFGRIVKKIGCLKSAIYQYGLARLLPSFSLFYATATL